MKKFRVVAALIYAIQNNYIEYSMTQCQGENIYYLTETNMNIVDAGWPSPVSSDSTAQLYRVYVHKL